MTGRMQAIWIKRAHTGIMDPAASATLVAGKEIVGNADQGSRRQVTLIEEEILARLVKGLSADLPTSTRRANFVVRDFPLIDSRGQIFTIGGCRLRVGGEVKRCNLMDELLPGMRQAMFPDWAGGAFAEVLEGGPVSVGDEIAWQLPDVAHPLTDPEKDTVAIQKTEPAKLD
ncbi:MAG: MOSC domain-containing protein [Acidobacteriota bacterium]